MPATIHYLPAKPKRDAKRDELIDHGNALLTQGWTDTALTNWLDRLDAWEAKTA